MGRSIASHAVIDYVMCHPIQAFAQALVDAGLRSLVRVDLSDNYFEGQGALHLAEALEAQTGLTELDLRDASLGDEGTAAVALALGRGLVR